MSRLSLSDADKQARDWFAETATSLGCKVSIDEMGNQFAIKPGERDGPPTVAGSHLDTQPTGGRYDGILGVTAGIEMLRVLQENHYQTEFPVGVVNWTNEEGARFPISMLASGVWSHAIRLSTAHSLASVSRSDPPGTTVLTALQRTGQHNPRLSCSHAATPLAAHFELHIEQGPHLQRAGRKVGVVDGVQAYRWFTITVTGRDAHTGTTGLESRADALLAAARMVVRCRVLSAEAGALATVGVIDAEPGAINTVPGRVTFRLDVRGATDERLEALEAVLRRAFEDIARGGGDGGAGPWDEVAVSWRTDSDSRAVRFHDDCIDCVERAAEEACAGRAMRMTSGAGHDSVHTSRVVPTSMVFVPCLHGVSHNPREFCDEENCAVGAGVLMNAVVKYDELRRARGG